MKTIVSYGRHSAVPHFETFNSTDIEIGDDSVLIIESGGQYQEGTTKVTRTIHFGVPTTEQKTAYTNVLKGIIRLSTLVFPDKLKTSEVDALTRYEVILVEIIMFVRTQFIDSEKMLESSVGKLGYYLTIFVLTFLDRSVLSNM